MSLYSSLYRLLLKILEILPYRALFIIGKCLSVGFYLCPNEHKKVSLANLNHVFQGKTKLEIKTILKESLFHSSMAFLESGLVWGKKSYTQQDSFIEIINYESIENSLKQGNGVLLFTPHLGNIEILINYLGSQTTCTIPYTRPKNIYLDEIITASRTASGVKMVNTNIAGIKQMLLELKAGNIVAIASDQVPKKGAGIHSSFFEKECYSMTLLPKLQEKTNCAVHPMYCERKENGKGFFIHFKDKIDLGLDLESGVDKMNYEFEKCIMMTPGQYSWEYKKFKRTTSEYIY
ncbi:MAG: lysophospholipid acyltransferase family protein [SAR86 cluster bacterium]|nr:lysophospholipid acyltransferase family protein [SAR86 cluster bacterium]